MRSRILASVCVAAMFVAACDSGSASTTTATRDAGAVDSSIVDGAEHDGASSGGSGGVPDSSTGPRRDAATDAGLPDDGVRDAGRIADGSGEPTDARSLSADSAARDGGGAGLSIGGDATILASCIASHWLMLGRAEAAGPEPELVFMDIRDPGHPSVASSVNLDATVHAVAIDGARAYAVTSADDRELVVVDFSDPYHPTILGAFDAPGDADGLRLEAIGNRVVLGRSAGPTAELEFLDVTDPAKVTETMAIEVGSDVNDFETNSMTAYVATSAPGAEIQAFDYGAGAPAAPFWTFSVGKPARALDVSERHLYVVTSDDENGALFDFRAEWHAVPSFQRSLSLSGDATDVVRYGGTEVVALRNHSVVFVEDEPIQRDAAVADAGRAAFRVRSSVSAPDVRTLALRGDALFAAGDHGRLAVARSGLAPRIRDAADGGIRTVSILGDSNTKHTTDLQPGSKPCRGPAGRRI